MKQRIIIVDNNTFGILCECATFSIAHSVSCGFINSSVKVLPSNLPWLGDEFNKNFNNREEHYQHRNGRIHAMIPSLITDSWLALKNLALLRNQFHLSWETRCNQFLLNRNVEYAHLDKLDGFLWQELNACKPAEEFYTQAIVEWASLSDVSTRTAYQELKLKAESRGLQTLRNHAVHQKYVFLLNQESTKENLQKVLTDGIQHLLDKTQL